MKETHIYSNNMNIQSEKGTTHGIIPVIAIKEDRINNTTNHSIEIKDIILKIGIRKTLTTNTKQTRLNKFSKVILHKETIKS